MSLFRFFAVREEVEEFSKFRGIVNRDLSDDIQDAEQSGWDAGRLKQIKEDIRRLLTLATAISMRLLVVAVILAVVVVMCVGTNGSHNTDAWWYRVAGVVAIAIAGTALWLYWPLVGIVRTIWSLPNEVYRDLLQPIRINLDLLNIAINLVVLLYVLLPLRIGGAYPLVFILVAIWLFAPLGLFFAGRGGWFLATRVGQLLVLFALASFVVVSPVPMSHYQWRAQHDMAESLRVADQREITARWADLQWFTPEGASLVWYSYRNDGYHLYASPGHDPLTNSELAEVADDGMRQKIVADLKQRKDARARAEAEDRQRAARVAAQKEEAHKKQAMADKEEQARREAARIAEEKARAAKEREEASRELVRKYVYPQFVDGSNKSGTVLIALDENGKEDSGLSARLSTMLTSAGYPNVTAEFTPSFVASDLFTKLNSGNGTGLAFPVGDFAARILVIRQRAALSHETAAGSENLTTVTITFNVRLLRANSGRVEFENEVSGRGVAYKESTARGDALERAQSAVSGVAGQLAAAK